MAGEVAVLGVVGTGAMGQGIIQVALQGGLRVLAYDAQEGAAERGRDQVFARLDRLVEKGTLEANAVAAMKRKFEICDDLAGFASCDAVIEAVFEDLELKRGIFSKLEAAVGAECILASNTSSLLIASIARVCQHRGRVAGMHFFNPVPLMKLVEIVRGPDTSADVADRLVALGNRLGRTPVIARDAPGFIVNHGGRAYTTEAMRVLHEDVASAAQIDAIMRDCCGFRMGPCELMDLTGVDVNLPVSEMVYKGFSDDHRLKTSFPHLALFEAGRLGRKTGQGHYRYDEKGRMIDPPSADDETTAEPARRVVLVEDDGALGDFARSLGLEPAGADDGEIPLLAAPFGEDCTHLAMRTGVDFRRLVAVDLVCDTAARVTLMSAPGADPRSAGAVSAAIAASGRKVTRVADSPGFVGQRIQAMIANLGCEMAQIGIAGPHDIDTALRLGLNYPKGPLELAEAIGPGRVLEILERLQHITGEDRYRPSLWLKRRALLGLPIHTPN